MSDRSPRMGIGSLRDFIQSLPLGFYSDRQIKERRDVAKQCICPSHASNRGECPVHDKRGHPRCP